MDHSSNGSTLFFIDNSRDPDDLSAEDEFYQTDLNKENTRSLKEIFGISFANTRNISASIGQPEVYFTTRKKNSTEPLKLWFYNSIKPSDNAPYFTLVNADTDQDISWLKDGDNILMNQTPHVNIRYNDTGTYASVVFKLNGNVYRTENAWPYTLAGYANSTYTSWLISEGDYELTATPYSLPDGAGTAGTPLTINFKVIETADVLSVAHDIKQESITLEVYPNPSFESFTFSLESKESGAAKAEIFRLDGSRIETILDAHTSAGDMVQFTWNSKNLPQGVYLCKYSSGKMQLVKRLMLNR